MSKHKRVDYSRYRSPQWHQTFLLDDRKRRKESEDALTEFEKDQAKEEAAHKAALREAPKPPKSTDAPLYHQQSIQRRARGIPVAKDKPVLSRPRTSQPSVAPRVEPQKNKETAMKRFERLLAKRNED